MIVGIDLGTTFSAASSVSSVGTPVLFGDRIDPSRYHTPSVVHIQDGKAFVGDLVEQMLVEDPSIPICRFAKSSLAEAGAVYKDREGQEWNAHAISALILRKLKMDAEISNQTITRCVISVPAHFNEAEKRATIDAARLADLPVVGLVEEPVAAATFAVAGSQGKDKTVFVFDLGGGTLDATILHGSGEGLYVLATEGAARLGGKNFDEVIIDLVADQYRTQFKQDPYDDSAAMQTLRAFSTKAKIELSQNNVMHVTKPIMLMGKPQRITISRPVFEASSQHLIEGCLDVCHRVLRSAALSWSQIDELVLVGGGSLLPCVEQAIIRDSNLPPHRILRNQPHSSVAFGAALLAESQFGNRETIVPPLKQSVSTNQLGLRMLDPVKMRPYFHVMVERNTPLPVKATKEIYTSAAGQDTISIEVLQRKDEYTSPDVLGKLKFGPLPNPCKNYPITVTLGYDAHSRVTVDVCDARTGEKLEKIISGDEESNLTLDYQRISGLQIII